MRFFFFFSHLMIISIVTHSHSHAHSHSHSHSVFAPSLYVRYLTLAFSLKCSLRCPIFGCRRSCRGPGDSPHASSRRSEFPLSTVLYCHCATVVLAIVFVAMRPLDLVSPFLLRGYSTFHLVTHAPPDIVSPSCCSPCHCTCVTVSVSLYLCHCTCVTGPESLYFCTGCFQVRTRLQLATASSAASVSFWGAAHDIWKVSSAFVYSTASCSIAMQ